VGGIPFVVIDGKYAPPGAQPVHVLSDALRQAWAEANPVNILAVATDADGIDRDGTEPSYHHQTTAEKILSPPPIPSCILRSIPAITRPRRRVGRGDWRRGRPFGRW
jgi:hypothetical protein